jgi:hypothetical protein
LLCVEFGRFFPLSAPFPDTRHFSISITGSVRCPIKGCLKKLRDDKRIIVHTSSYAQKGVEYILGRFEQQPISSDTSIHPQSLLVRLLICKGAYDYNYINFMCRFDEFNLHHIPPFRAYSLIAATENLKSIAQQKEYSRLLNT